MANNWRNILTSATIDGETHTCIAVLGSNVIALNRSTGFTLMMSADEWVAKL